MKKSFLTSLILLATIFSISAQNESGNTQPRFEVKVITSVESIVPLGLGRSRLISSNVARDYKEFSSEQTEEDNTRNKSKRYPC